MGRSGLSCLSLDVWSGNLSGLTEAFSDVTLLVGWAFGFACAAFLSAELEGQITHFVTSAFAVIEATVDAVFFRCCFFEAHFARFGWAVFVIFAFERTFTEFSVANLIGFALRILSTGGSGAASLFTESF